MNFPKGIHIYGDKNFRGKCPLEKHEAQAFFALLRNFYPSIGLIATHQRNEGKRTKWQTFQHKKEGMVKGAPDIIIPGMPSFACEMKRKDHTKSEITEAQVDYLMACKAQGSFTCIALGAEAAIEAVKKWVAYSRALKIKLNLISQGVDNASGDLYQKS